MSNNHQGNGILNFISQNSFASSPLPALPQHESFLFDSTSSSPEFPKKLDLPYSSIEFPKKPAPDHDLDVSYSVLISLSE